jgi:hypothetical protein
MGTGESLKGEGREQESHSLPEVRLELIATHQSVDWRGCDDAHNLCTCGAAKSNRVLCWQKSADQPKCHNTASTTGIRHR